MIASTARGSVGHAVLVYPRGRPVPEDYDRYDSRWHLLDRRWPPNSCLRNFRFNQGLIELLNNVDALSPAVRASGEEAFDMVVPAMKVRDFHFTEVTRF